MRVLPRPPAQIIQGHAIIGINGGSLRRVVLLLTILTSVALSAAKQTAVLTLSPLDRQSGHMYAAGR